jgi:lipopolysaccharide transport system permease protein
MTWILFCRDLKASFRGSFLGYIWLFLPPLATTLVWIVLNKSNVVNFADPTIPYPLFVLIGTVVWSAFTRATTLPLQTFQTSKSLRAFFDAMLYLLTAALVVPFFQVSVSPAVLLLPLILLVAVLLGFALSMVLLPASALYADVQQALVLVFSVAIYLAPVVYPLPKTGSFAGFVAWNPVTPLINSAREAFFVGLPSAWPALLLIAAVSGLVVVLTFAAMRIAMPHLTARMGM